MTPDATTLLGSQVGAAAACAYIINLLQMWSKTPWITAHTKYVNIAVRALLSGGAYVGISHVWSPSTTGGGVLTITIPSLTVIVIGVWHWFCQYAFTHVVGTTLESKQAPPQGANP